MLPSIEKEVKRQSTDFVLFSRNDQVANRIMIGPIIRKLRTGYCSFSGIDDIDRISQMKDCYSAFMECNQRFSYENDPLGDEVPDRKGSGTFSLVFDVEQVGCIRVGLSRILKLLDRYGVKSTFFITNIMSRICPDLVQTLTSNLHEVGIHGKYHEYLSNFNLDVQSRLLAEAKEDLGCPVSGVNLLYRMNKDTIEAISQNNIDYFVTSMMSQYKFYQYLKVSSLPGIVSSLNRDIVTIPISIQTYGQPWFSIKNMIDTVYSISQEQGRHITILCHPFRDGNARNVLITEKIIKYLVVIKKMKPITLRDLKDRTILESSTNRIEYQDDFLKSGRIPHRMTTMDFSGLIPENAMLMWRLMKYPHAVW